MQTDSSKSVTPRALGLDIHDFNCYTEDSTNMHLLGAFSSKNVTLTFECVVAEALGEF
jgi:hypothetical protein